MTTNDDSIPELEARPGIMKCAGAGLQACSRCTRALAPAAEDEQRWVDPDIADGVCRYMADVAKCAFFYQPMTAEMREAVDRHNARFNTMLDGYDVAADRWISPPQILIQE